MFPPFKKVRWCVSVLCYHVGVRHLKAPVLLCSLLHTWYRKSLQVLQDLIAIFDEGYIYKIYTTRILAVIWTICF